MPSSCTYLGFQRELSGSYSASYYLYSCSYLMVNIIIIGNLLISSGRISFAVIVIRCKVYSRTNRSFIFIRLILYSSDKSNYRLLTHYLLLFVLVNHNLIEINWSSSSVSNQLKKLSSSYRIVGKKSETNHFSQTSRRHANVLPIEQIRYTGNFSKIICFKWFLKFFADFAHSLMLIRKVKLNRRTPSLTCRRRRALLTPTPGNYEE